MITFAKAAECGGESRPLIVGRKSRAPWDQAHLVPNWHRQTCELSGPCSRRGHPFGDAGPGRLVQSEGGRAIATEIDEGR